MKALLRSLPPLAAVLILAIGGFAGIGCSRKLPVGPVGQSLAGYPEGRRDSLERTPSDLIVWSDQALVVTDTSTNDSTRNRVFTVYRSAPGVIHGLIVDYSQAGGYQMFRQEDGGGYRTFADFMLTATRRWSERSYYGAAGGPLVLPPAQIFRFADQAPAAIPLKRYVGRAVIGGLTGTGYPLTNAAATPDTAGLPPLRYTGLVGLPGGPVPSPPDSLLAMSWETVPGAAGYWVHIYQKRADIREIDAADAITIAHPSPIASGKVRDLFIGYFPAPRTSYKLGNPVPPGCRVLVYRVLIGLQEVLIRISAVDGSGRMIATTGSAGDQDAVAERFGEVDRRRTFLLNAKKVTPGRPVPPP